MFRENSFAIMLGLSLLGHASIFAFSPSGLNAGRFLLPKEKEAADVEITYFQIRETPQIKEVPQWVTIPQKTNSEEKVSVESTTENKIEVPAEATLGTSQTVKVALPKEAPAEEKKEGQGQTLEEETLTKEMTSRLRDPVFMTYYQGIREKIRKAAKRRYQNRLAQGDVSVGFTLFSNGRVKEVRVLKENPQTASLLRSLAIQSLLDASPFPPFPDPLRHDQISFLVVLTFEPKP